MFGNKAFKAAFLISSLMLASLGFSLQANAACNFVATQDGSPLVIKDEYFTTPEAKQFKETCINPYTKRFAADPELGKKAKKYYGTYSCSQCHGPGGTGQTGPSIVDDVWQYPKHVTDKGMFETIWHGTNNGMGAKGRGLMVEGDNETGFNVDELLQLIGWFRLNYKGTGEKPWLQ